MGYSIVTTAPSGSPEWLAARRGKIGGTAAANILCGGDPDIRTFGTPLTEWLRMTGRKTEGDIAAKDPALAKILRWGTRSEPMHRRILEDETGGRCEDAPGVCQSTEFDWFAVCPDGFFTLDGVRRVHEMKAPTQWRRDDWFDGAPLAVKVQLAACMFVLDEPHGIASALIQPDVLWQNVERNPAFDRILVDTLGHFVEYHVAKDIPPRVTGYRDERDQIMRLHPRENGRTIFLPGSCEADFYDLEEWERRRDEAEAEVERLKTRIALAIVPNSEAYCGPFRATYHWTTRSAYTVSETEYPTLRVERK